jgi:hypothetical protein
MNRSSSTREVPELNGTLLLEQRTFRKADFTETAEGHARLKAPLTHELVESLPRWAAEVAPVAERFAHDLGREMAGKYRPVTPLTRGRSKAAAAAVNARKASAKAAADSSTKFQRRAGETAPTLWTCPDCAAPVSNPRHVRCDACIEADPRQTPEIRGRRGAAIASRKKALREWDDANPDIDFDPEMFRPGALLH